MKQKTVSQHDQSFAITISMEILKKSDDEIVFIDKKEMSKMPSLI